MPFVSVCVRMCVVHAAISVCIDMRSRQMHAVVSACADILMHRYTEQYSDLVRDFFHECILHASSEKYTCKIVICNIKKLL